MIEYADKTQTGDYNPSKWNAQDANEVKQQVNALYKSYSASLNQEGTDNPTVVVYYNGLGQDINWVRTDIGRYEGRVTGFIFNTTKTSITPKIQSYNFSNKEVFMYISNSNTIQVNCRSIVDDQFVDISATNVFQIEIKIHN